MHSSDSDLVPRLAAFLARLEAAPGVTAAHLRAASLLAESNDPGGDEGDADAMTAIFASGSPGLLLVPPKTHAVVTNLAPVDTRPVIALRPRRRQLMLLALTGLVLAGLPTCLAPDRGPAVVPAPGPSSSTPPPAPALPAAEPALPASSVALHVEVEYAHGDDAAERSSAAVVRSLREAGYAVGDPAPAVVATGASGVFCFFPADLAGAAGLAGQLWNGATPRLLHIAAGALPRPGTVRIAIPAGEAVAAKDRHS